MSIVGKWSAIVAGCDLAEAEHNYEGVYAAAAESRSQAFAECMRDVDDASTPRPPQVEWFEKWDAWWVSGTPESYSTIFREVETFEMGGGTLPKLVMVRGLVLGSQVPTCWPLSHLGMVVPVRREGPPAMDVGWGWMKEGSNG